MRLQVVGENRVATTLRGQFNRLGWLLTSHFPTYRLDVSVDETGLVDTIVIDTVDGALERAAVNYITELSPAGRVVLQRTGGNRDDRALVLTLPQQDEAEWYACEVGVLRALLSLQQRKRWWRR